MFNSYSKAQVVIRNMKLSKDVAINKKKSDFILYFSIAVFKP